MKQSELSWPDHAKPVNWKEDSGLQLCRQADGHLHPVFRISDGTQHAYGRVDVAGFTIIDAHLGSTGAVEYRLRSEHQTTELQMTVTPTVRFDGASFHVDIASDSPVIESPTVTVKMRVAGPPSHYWTGWGNPDLSPRAPVRVDPLTPGASTSYEHWVDPLQEMVISSSFLHYGATVFDPSDPQLPTRPLAGDVTCLPMIALLAMDAGVGWTVGLDPAGFIQDLTIELDGDGQVAINKIGNRLWAETPHSFSFWILRHESSWRAALRSFRSAARAFFEPLGPVLVSGSGAFSTQENTLDVDFLTEIGFAANWKASYDFPYMGLFVPTVEENTRWRRFGGGETSTTFLDQYAREMLDSGFDTLNYFNVTEFGAYIDQDHLDGRDSSTRGARDWVPEAVDYIRKEFPAAVLRVAPEVCVDKISNYPRTRVGGPYFTWKDGIVVDPGEPSYRAHLLEQASRLLKQVPHAAGIAIDRMDWLRLSNPTADDGTTVYRESAARSLFWSWRTLMNELGPMYHDAGKVIFVNNHVKRIDLLQHVDGIFDEFTYAGAALNLTALLCTDRQAMGWLNSERQLMSEPDAYFQRFLHLGVFPMAPYPDNDHSIEPSPEVERLYLDYAELFRTLKGRRWALDLNISVSTGRVNAFMVEAGYAVVVTGCSGAETEVRIEGVDASSGRVEVLGAIVPGGSIVEKPVASVHESTLRVISKVQRGATLIMLKL